MHRNFTFRTVLDVNKTYNVSSQEQGSGAHFNHSIWDKDGKKNLFWDPSKHDKMSDFARHWMAGLVKHTYAMTAILCPTVNCYRRMHGVWAPSGV